MTNNNDNYFPFVLFWFLIIYTYCPISTVYLPLSIVFGKQCHFIPFCQVWILCFHLPKGTGSLSLLLCWTVCHCSKFLTVPDARRVWVHASKFRYEGGALGITSPVFLTSSYSYWEKDCSSSPCAVSNTFSREARTSFQLVLAFWWEYFTSLKENILS